MFGVYVALMEFMFCSTGVVDCGAELVLGALWVMELTLEVREDVAGATGAVERSALQLLLGVGGEIVITESINNS